MRLKEPVHSNNSKIQESAFDTQLLEPSLGAEALEKMPSQRLKPKPTSFWYGLRRRWQDLNFRTKLTVVLLAATAIPLITVTQVLTSVAQSNARTALQERLQSQEDGFVNDYLLWVKDESGWQARTIGEAIQAVGIDLQNPTQLKNNSSLLQSLVSEMMTSQDRLRPDFHKSFRIITNAQGRTVAQYIQTHTNYPLNSSPKKEEIIQAVSLPTGINLGDISIIKDVQSTGRSLSGVELLEEKTLQRLGLNKQAINVLQPQGTQNLPEPKQPLPKGTYPDVDRGTAGLVAMAVEPIKVQDKIVGFALVGLLLNNNHSVVDTFSKTYNTDVTLFARDLSVSTTVPFNNTKNRATGTRAAREVAEAVLNQGKDFSGQTSGAGKEYITAYSPLYDHQKELNPTGAKPVGMAFMGTTLEEVQNTTGRQQLLGYGIGGSMLLLAGLLLVPIAESFSRPLRRLSGFAQQVAAGKHGVRLESTEGQDEIGLLSQEMNKMAASIEANLEAVRRGEELRLQEQEKAIRQQAENAQQQRLGKEQLQKRALELLVEVDPISRGDLTTRARVTDDEIGTIADSYNATVENLRKIVTQVQTAAQKMAATTSSSEASVQELSTEALRQTEEIAVALDRIQEMANSIRAVAKNAEQAEIAVQQANQTVEAGEAAMNLTVDGILAIRETVADTSTKVQRLGEASQRISKVVNLIGRFAAQTNLLALKASIEAARAGEEGRGFAIIADEVRMLASQSAQATTEIESLVAAIQTETNEVAAAMVAGTEQVVEGTRLVNETRQSLNNITAASVQIGALVEAIASAAVTQTHASESVTQTMSGVAAISNQTSNEATQVSASFKELLEVAQELQASAAQFKVR